MSWRETQLEWYGGDVIQQDYDLEKFIIDNKITGIRYIGDSEHLKPILNKDNAEVNLCVFLINSPFKFSDVMYQSNLELKKLKPNSFLYLAINKFLAIPEPQYNIDDDYDKAIYNYVLKNINYKLINYSSGKQDGGKHFNWVHPLTRFYFRNEHNI